MSGVKCVSLLPYAGAGCLLVTGRTSFPFPPHLHLDLDTFMSDSRLRISRVSRALSQRNIPALAGLVSPGCLDSLRVSVFQQMSPQDISRLAIQPGDIFFQFLHQAVQKDGLLRIKVVSYSLANLDQSRANQNNYEAFKQELQARAARTQGILQKEDMNVKEFRRLQDKYEILNPAKVTKEQDILITNYMFELPDGPNSDWTITEVCHVCSSSVWSWLRRLVWKGRVVLSVNLDVDFSRVLRYEYMVDASFLLLMVYLQMLAFIIGYRVDQESQRRTAAQLSQPDSEQLV